jgi:hypothetical protein
MSQIQQLGFFANNLTVNTAANTATITNTLVVGNSSVNVVINSSSVYVSGVALGSGGSANAAAQYAFTNTISFSNVVTHTANISVNGAIILGGSNGTVGQVLTSNGTSNAYWSSAGFSNNQSIAVSNIAFANTSNTASAYTFYNTTTASLDTVFV